MKKVIITIDTEGHAGSDPIRHLIWGETKNGQMGGIPLLMDLFDEFNAKGLFFLDFAEAFDYGYDKIEKVARYIVDRGHDVGVHIHPDHMMPSKKKFLFEYSDEEQFEIISRCTELYTKIIGSPPTSFRAGKYGANLKTLDILSELGYKADFSQFFGYEKWCHILPPVTGDESVSLDNGLIEFPVMSYRHRFNGLFDRYDKLDINCSRAEHKKVLNAMIEDATINVIVMFVHSFSLLDWRQNVEAPIINKQVTRNLRLALKQVNENKNLEFVSIDNLLMGSYKTCSEATKIVPTISGFDALRFYYEKGIEYLKVMYLSRKYGELL